MRRHLLTEGEAGAMQDWYIIIRAARYLGVAPWEMLNQPIYWQQKALEAERIDAEVQEAQAQQAKADAPTG